MCMCYKVNLNDTVSYLLFCILLSSKMFAFAKKETLSFDIVHHKYMPTHSKTVQFSTSHLGIDFVLRIFFRTTSNITTFYLVKFGCHTLLTQSCTSCAVLLIVSEDVCLDHIVMFGCILVLCVCVDNIVFCSLVGRSLLGLFSIKFRNYEYACISSIQLTVE